MTIFSWLGISLFLCFLGFGLMIWDHRLETGAYISGMTLPYLKMGTLRLVTLFLLFVSISSLIYGLVGYA